MEEVTVAAGVHLDIHDEPLRTALMSRERGRGKGLLSRLLHLADGWRLLGQSIVCCSDQSEE